MRLSASLWDDWRKFARQVFILSIVPFALAALTAPARGEDSKPASEAPTPKDQNSKATKPEDEVGQRRQSSVGVNEELGFKQAKVSAEMSELEERMYRLSEAIKRVEPDNSSRLMSGVKYAREELILHEMQDLENLLTKSDYKLAANQEKEVLVKLDRLEQMLLSSDLDLQLQLQKLRALREVLHRLDTAIQEEDREQKLSTDNTERDRQRQSLPALREKLDELIRRQTAHVEAGSKLVEDQPAANAKDSAAESARPVSGSSQTQSSAESTAQQATEEKDAASKTPASEALLKNQKQTRDDAHALEERMTELAEARGQMDEAIFPLEKNLVPDALPHQKQALESLKRLAALLDGRQKEIAEALSQERFNGMKRDQEQNHAATDSINEAVRQLGDSGAGAVGELSRAGGSMRGAEGHLADRQPEPAGQNQNEALASLKYAREQLAEEEQQLLGKIRAEVKKRVLEDITEMIERQVAVRESTQKLAPKMKDGSRQALASVAALAKSEERIMQIGNDLVALVDETEFGIALPAALRAVIEEMDDVKQSLAGGTASDDVVAAERQIEADLKALLDAMKQMPAQASGKQQKGSQQDRQRELNRIIAELKMIRILQTRVTADTKHVDEKRSEVEELSAALRQKIQNIHDRQQDVRDVTDKLTSERGNEVR
jgi:hypothetical protein